MATLWDDLGSTSLGGSTTFQRNTGTKKSPRLSSSFTTGSWASSLGGGVNAKPKSRLGFDIVDFTDKMDRFDSLNEQDKYNVLSQARKLNMIDKDTHLQVIQQVDAQAQQKIKQDFEKSLTPLERVSQGIMESPKNIGDFLRTEIVSPVVSRVQSVGGTYLEGARAKALSDAQRIVTEYANKAMTQINADAQAGRISWDEAKKRSDAIMKEVNRVGSASIKATQTFSKSDPVKVAGDASKLFLDIATLGTSAKAKAAYQATRQAAKAGIKMGAKEAAKRIGVGVFEGAALGGAYGGLDVASRQGSKLSLADVLPSVGQGVAIGGALGGLVTGAGVAANQRLAQRVATGSPSLPSQVSSKLSDAVNQSQLPIGIKKTLTKPIGKAPQVTTIRAAISDDLAKTPRLSKEINTIKSSKLQLGTDALGEVDTKQITKYVDDIKAGKIIDPIVITKEGGEVFVQDGKHRLLAAKQLGIDDIPIVEQSPKSTPQVTKTVQQAIPETQVSGGAKKLTAKAQAIAKELDDTLPEPATYGKVSYKDEAAKAIKLVDDNRDEAMSIAMGNKQGDNVAHEQAILKALAKKAEEEGDVDTVMRLASSKRYTELSESAQKLGVTGYGERKNAADIINDIKKTQTKTVERRAKTQVNKLKTKTIKDISKNLKNPDKYDWTNFVESLRCK